MPFVRDFYRAAFRPLSPSLFALLIGPLAVTVNQNRNTKGFQTSTTERKIVLYADDVLLFLQDPARILCHHKILL